MKFWFISIDNNLQFVKQLLFYRESDVWMNFVIKWRSKLFFEIQF